MENTVPSGLTVVDSPRPYAGTDVDVDEQFMTDEIEGLWLTRQIYNGALQGQKSAIRFLETELGQMLYTMKTVLLRPGRGDGWSEYLRGRKIPQASADRWVARYQRTLGEEIASEANHEPTEKGVDRFFSEVWPRLHKKLSTSESVYWFICALVAATGVGYEFRDGGIHVLSISQETALGAMPTKPLGVDYAALMAETPHGEKQG